MNLDLDHDSIILIKLGAFLIILFILYKAFRSTLTEQTTQTKQTTQTTKIDMCEDKIDLSLLTNEPFKSNMRTLVGNKGYGCNCNKHKFIEHIERFTDVGFAPDYAWLSNHNLLPWWNSTRHTRNMSYDIRGDVPIIPSYVGPWMNSPLI